MEGKDKVKKPESVDLRLILSIKSDEAQKFPIEGEEAANACLQLLANLRLNKGMPAEKCRLIISRSRCAIQLRFSA